MQAKEYFKGVGKALLAPVVKSLYDGFPNYGLGFSMLQSRTFTFDLNGKSAYNNKIFYTGANIIVRKMVEAPITFNRKKVESKKSFGKFYSKNISNPERNSIKNIALDEVENHELASMFTIEMMEDFWHNYNYGDGILWFEPIGDELSRNTKPVRIHSLNPSRVNIIKSSERFDSVYKYTYNCQNGELIDLDKRYVLHLRHWNPNVSQLKGYGIDMACANDIALNNAGNETEGAAFINGGRGTLFSSKSELNKDTGKMVDKMDATQMAILKKTIAEDLSGARNNRKLKFTNGEVVVTSYGDTLAEMEVNKSEDSRWRNIFAIMGIPQELAPINLTSSENSVVQGYKALVTNLVISELKKFDQKLTNIIKQWWTDIIAVSDLTEYSELAPDLKLMAEVYGKPTLSQNELRKIFGYDELPNGLGNNYLVANGLIKLEDLVSNDFDNTPEADTL